MSSTLTAAPYDRWLRELRDAKIAQTEEKLAREGGMDEDDYGRVVPPEGFSWEPIANHPSGSFFGYDGWATNFEDLMARHPLFVDPRDAIAGKWMFFMSRLQPVKWPPELGYDELKRELDYYATMSGISGDSHFAPDYTIGLELGWNGIADRLETERDSHGSEHAAFYDAELRVVRAVQGWIERHVGSIEELLDDETDPTRRENLRDLLEVNRRVVGEPPRTFHEASQWIAWFNMASRTYNRDGAGCQLDAVLLPYYRADIEAGRLSDERAIHILGCLLLNDPHYYQLGGPDENGADQTNELSYLILRAAAAINTTANLTIRVHDGLDAEFLTESVRCLVRYKNGWPRYSGDQALVSGLVRSGSTPELARRRVAVGCNWMSLPGLEYTMNDLVKVNVARVFEVALAETLEQADAQDPRPAAADEASAPSQATGADSPATTPSVAALWDRFIAHLERSVQVTANGMAFHLEHQEENEPELMLNLLSHGPVEEGRDVTRAARYFNLGIDGAGLATVADSFAAVEEFVEHRGLVSWSGLREAIASNWAGQGGARIRSILQSVPRYGHGGTAADDWAVRVSREFSKIVVGQSDRWERYVFIPGWFSWAKTIELGQNVGPTPDGRAAGAPVSHGANPNPGFRTDGAATAMANAIGSVQPGYGNTAPMQLEYDPGIQDEDEAVAAIEALIRGHMAQGGTLLNINIIDCATILAAHENPELYPDLVVRVTGFTAYWRMLSPRFRQLVVDRIIADG